MAIKAPPAASPKQPPYQPPGPSPLVCEEWQGVNTTTDRAGVPDKQVYWLDGFFPLAPRKLRALWGIGAALYTAPAGLTIVDYFFFNIAATAYVAVLLSDGSMVQVDMSGTVTAMMAAGTITSPSVNNVDFSQYGQSYLIIVANQTDGYWLWNGTVLSGAGGISPIVTLTNVGSGYSAPPAVVASGGSGHGAVFAASVSGGVVTGVTVVNPGTGYLPGDTVVLAFSGGNSSGSGANITANLVGPIAGSGATFSVSMGLLPDNSAFGVTGVAVISGGSNYQPLTTLVVSGGVPATLSPTIVGGVIVGVTIVNPGQYGSLSPPSVVASDPGTYSVGSVNIVSGGTGYSLSAHITVSGGGSPIAQATMRLNLTAGVITSVTLIYGGAYITATPPTLTVNDTAVNAAGTILLMPFGVSGNTVETYSGRVWVGKAALIEFTAPGSVLNFATSAGGGNISSGSSTLRVGYTKFIATNGFLYLIGDSSVDYISGVQTAGSPPVTTFTLQNADPEVGTPFPATVLAAGQGVVFANSWGAQLLRGSATQKMSEMLDGVYGTGFDVKGNLLGTSIQPSMSKAIIFNKKVVILLLTIIDPVSGLTQNKLLLWYNGQWFASLQDVPLTFVRCQEINSQLITWGSDGTHLYPLFNTPSTAFTKTMQTRLWDEPGGYEWTKAAVNLWGISKVDDPNGSAFTVRVDSERGDGNTYAFTPSGTGYFVMPPTAVGQQGELVGLTVQTVAADETFISFKLLEELVQYRG